MYGKLVVFVRLPYLYTICAAQQYLKNVCLFFFAGGEIGIYGFFVFFCVFFLFFLCAAFPLSQL